MIENQSRFVEIEGGRVHYLIEGSEVGRLGQADPPQRRRPSAAEAKALL